MILPRSSRPLPAPDAVSALACPSLGRRAASRRLSGALALVHALMCPPEYSGFSDCDPGPTVAALRSAHLDRVLA